MLPKASPLMSGEGGSGEGGLLTAADVLGGEGRAGARGRPHQRGFLLVEDAEGGVLRAGELLGRIEHLLEQVFEVELGDQRPADFQQAHQLRPG